MRAVLKKTNCKPEIIITVIEQFAYITGISLTGD